MNPYLLWTLLIVFIGIPAVGMTLAGLVSVIGEAADHWQGPRALAIGTLRTLYGMVAFVVGAVFYIGAVALPFTLLAILIHH